MKKILASLVLVAFSSIALGQAPTLTFTAQTTTGAGSVVPILSWNTTPAATSCSASGDWSGLKLATGTETLAPITSSKTYQMTCTWPGDQTATVSWTAPTTNTDGSALAKCASQTVTSGTCLLSFKVYRSDDANGTNQNSQTVNDRNATSFPWTNLAAGTHWFTATALNANGAESDLALPRLSKTIVATQNVNRSVAITVNPKPNAPVLIGVQ